MPDALEGAEGAESADRRLAVRRRLDETVGAAASVVSERSPTPSGPAVVAPWQLPAWGSRALLGTALAMSLALATVNQWHRPAPVVKRLRVPVDEAAINVQPVEEASVHELLPRMVRNELPPQEERNLMWHMLVCRGCFDQYVQLKHTTQTASEVRQELIRLVQR
ncbi:MAG: hypothetical protein K0Q72_2882, partial [Armatimonadetes bacterium]|nr:hypothetical protein [Armatimonadota bacterium]